jgi:hypothetical protein
MNDNIMLDLETNQGQAFALKKSKIPQIQMKELEVIETF